MRFGLFAQPVILTGPVICGHQHGKDIEEGGGVKKSNLLRAIVITMYDYYAFVTL